MTDETAKSTVNHQSTDELLEQVRAKGLRVLNLFQFESGKWRANLYRELGAYDFGDGETIQEALLRAIANAEGAAEPFYQPAQRTEHALASGTKRVKAPAPIPANVKSVLDLL